MKGLLKNNLYASISNIRFFAAVMILLGVFVIAIDNAIPSLLIGYPLLSMIGFSVNAIFCQRKENASKWEKYKLTFPVTRKDIIKSHFASQAVWLFIGTVLAAVCLFLSILLHGFPFDRHMDVLMILTLGIGISLFTGTLFFPLSYLGDSEKNEAVLIVSLLGAIGIVLALISFLNRLFGPRMSTPLLVLSAAIILLCSLLCFVLSYPVTIAIFRKKEY